VQGLLQLLSKRDVPTRRGVSTLGYVETPAGPRWVAPGTIIAPDGFREKDTVLYLAGKKTARLAERVRYRQSSIEETRALAREAFPLLPLLNEPQVVLPILGWFFAAPFRPRIMAKHGKFPILCVWGTQGSGKTSIIKDVFWPLAGIEPNTEPFSATATQFALLQQLSSTGSVPVFIDEYKPRDMGETRVKDLIRNLRCLYNGEAVSRGRPDQTLVYYILKAPVCLAGESAPGGDDALNERLISVSPNKNTLMAREFQTVFQQLRRLPLSDLAAPYIQFAMARDTAADLERALSVTLAVLANAKEIDKLKDRCRHNLMVAIFGLLMFEEFAQSLGVQTPELDLDAVVPSCVAHPNEDDERTKDAFDRFLESLAAYALMGALEEGRHYTMANGYLCIHLRSCYEVYLTERRRAGLDDETNGLSALRRIVREKLEQGSYVVQMDRRVYLAKQFVRTVAIDPEKVPEALDIDAFASSLERPCNSAA
jgi:DNA primase